MSSILLGPIEPEIRTGEPGEWHDISTAPRDGTVIDVTNNSMRDSGWSVNAKWGKFSQFGKTTDEFVLVKDFDEFMPMKPGGMIIARWWRPAWRT